MAKKTATAGKSQRRTRSREAWRTTLYKKKYEVVSWDWKDDPRPNIRDLCRPFGFRPSLKKLDAVYPEKLLGLIAVERGLRVYEVPSLDGSDVYGFILSRESLTRREIQQIEADFWGEDFDEVYNPERPFPQTQDRDSLM